MFIVSYTRVNGFPPTIREIGKAMRVVSNNAVTDYLKALERKGYIERRFAGSRCIRVLKEAA